MRRIAELDRQTGTLVGCRLLLEPEDAARQLSVSERTLRRLAKDGEVRAVKIGQLTRFAPEDLAQLVEEKRGSS